MSVKAATISQEILLFSVLRQHVGASHIIVELWEGMTGADLLDHLVEQYPVIAPYRLMIRLAVNQEYVNENIKLSAGDEIAMITPVSGG